MRKFLSILLSLLIVLPSVLIGLGAEEGPAGDPIVSAADFAAMEADGTYYLSADITLDTSYGTFNGTLDGNGRKITTSVPVFATLTGATVKNLTIEGAVSDTGNVGALSRAGSGVTIENVTNNATVTLNEGNKYAGGLIGSVTTGKGTAATHEKSYFTNCVNNGAVADTITNNTQRLGGLVGNAAKFQYCVYTDCVNNGDITSVAEGKGSYVGGIAGSTFGGEAIRCINNGNISSDAGSGWAGGIIARLTPSSQGTDQSVKFVDCVNNGKISVETGEFSSGGYAGGISAGTGTTELKSGAYAVYSFDGCINNGEVTCGGNYAAGIISYTYGQGYKESGNYQYTEIRDCINTGKITGTKNVNYRENWETNPKTDPGANPNTYVGQFMGYTNCNDTLIENCIGKGVLSSLGEDFQVFFGLSSANASAYKISGNKVVAGTKNFSYAMDAYVKDSTTSEYSLTLTATGDRSANRIPLTAELAEKVEILSEAEITALICAKGIHTISKVDAKEATCTIDGNVACYTCADCGKFFSDEEGTTVLDSVTVAAAHTFTEDSDVCTVCGFPKDTNSLKAAYGTPVIDGTVDDVWATAPAYSYESYDYITKKGTDVKPGQIRILWDENYIYLLAEINDDTILDDSVMNTDKNWHTRDKVAFVFCPTNDKTDNTSADKNTSFWFGIRTNGSVPNFSARKPAAFITEEEGGKANDCALVVDSSGTLAPDSAMFRVSRTENGYLVESKVNLNAAELGEFTPADGAKFGFDSYVYDNTTAAAAQNHVYPLADRGITSYKNNSKKGTVELLPKPVTEPTGPVSYDDAENGDVLYTVDFRGDEVYKPFAFRYADAKMAASTAVPSEDGKSAVFTVPADAKKAWFWGGAFDGLKIGDGKQYTITFQMSFPAGNAGFYFNYGYSENVEGYDPLSNTDNNGLFGFYGKLTGKSASLSYGAGQKYKGNVLCDGSNYVTSPVTIANGTFADVKVEIDGYFYSVYLKATDSEEWTLFDHVNMLDSGKWTKAYFPCDNLGFSVYLYNNSAQTEVKNVVVKKGVEHTAASFGYALPELEHGNNDTAIDYDSAKDGDKLTDLVFNAETGAYVAKEFQNGATGNTNAVSDDGKSYTSTIPADGVKGAVWYGDRIGKLKITPETKYTFVYQIKTVSDTAYVGGVAYNASPYDPTLSRVGGNRLNWYGAFTNTTDYRFNFGTEEDPLLVANAVKYAYNGSNFPGYGYKDATMRSFATFVPALDDQGFADVVVELDGWTWTYYERGQSGEYEAIQTVDNVELMRMFNGTEDLTVIDDLAFMIYTYNVNVEMTVKNAVLYKGNLLADGIGIPEEKPEEPPVHQHNLVKTEAVAATCEAGGNKEYYTCSDCGNVYSNEAGTVLTTVEACAIAALGHKWGAWEETKIPTETAEGEMKRICGNDETHVQTIILSKLTVSDKPVVSDELAAVESVKTPELIKSSFEAGAAAQEGFKDAKVKVVEVDLKVSLDGGTTFVPATNDIIPSSGIVIILPYPAGVDKDKNDFLVAHMLAAATAEHPAGYIEYLKPEKTAEGLKVTVYSVSPFAVIWTSNEQQQTTPVTGDGTVWFALLAVISLGGAVIGVRKAGKKD